ncbi:ribonuclease H, partial [Striga asiatica]
ELDSFGIKHYYDRWLDTPLVDAVQSIPDFANLDATVEHYIVDGSWREDMIFTELPMELAIKVYGYPLSKLTAFDDRWVWRHSANGVFTSISAVVANVWRTVKEMEDAFRRPSSSGKGNVEIAWKPPANGVVKINTDGASLGNPGVAGAGAFHVTGRVESVGTKHTDEEKKTISTLGRTSGSTTDFQNCFSGLRHLNGLKEFPRMENLRRVVVSVVVYDSSFLENLFFYSIEFLLNYIDPVGSPINTPDCSLRSLNFVDPVNNDLDSLILFLARLLHLSLRKAALLLPMFILVTSWHFLSSGVGIGVFFSILPRFRIVEKVLSEPLNEMRLLMCSMREEKKPLGLYNGLRVEAPQESNSLRSLFANHSGCRFGSSFAANAYIFFLATRQ